MRLLSKGRRGDIAIDLGTANTLVFVKGVGLVVNEPSVVAITERSGKTEVLAVGEEARAMVGRTPEVIRAIRPMRGGVISDFEATQALIAHFIKRCQRRRLGRPSVVLSCPHGATPVERRAVRESAEAAGAGEVFLLEEPMAAAIGAGLPVNEPNGTMIVDSGGGTTEVALISLGGIVKAENCRLGGFDLDAVIASNVKRQYGLSIGEDMAERIKREVGAALPPEDGDGRSIDVKGLDQATGVPAMATITEREVAEWFGEPLRAIIDGLFAVWRETPPELAGDVVERGIWLTGGGALLRRFDEYIRQTAGLPVAVTEDPLLCGVYGCGEALDQLAVLRRAEAA